MKSNSKRKSLGLSPVQNPPHSRPHQHWIVSGQPLAQSICHLVLQRSFVGEVRQKRAGNSKLLDTSARNHLTADLLN